MNIITRKASSNEWQKVVDIYKHEGLVDQAEKIEKGLEKEFKEIDNNRIIWFAEDEGNVVGVIQLVFNYKDLGDGKNAAIIHHLRVSKKYEGKGIGSSLIKTVEEEVKKRNIGILNLEVEKSNERAIVLYKHLGYKYTKDGEDPSEIILTKQITE